jgi:hypothetical protein
MKLILKFRGDIQHTLNWPEAPPTFKHPWHKPLSIGKPEEMGKPNIMYVEYQRKSINGNLVIYEADYSNLINF